MSFTTTLYKPAAPQWDGSTKNLTFDYFESNLGGSNSKPSVMVVHGGGFVGGDKTRVHSYCKLLQANGWNAFSVQYSLGFNETTVGNFQAINRAVQDLKDFILYIKLNAVTFKVSTQKIYCFGVSAGAIAMYEMIYNSNFISDSGITVEGIGGFCGAKVATTVISKNMPVLLVHGKHDGKVPYNTRLWDDDLNRYELTDTGLNGSGTIVTILQQQNTYYEFYSSEFCGHVGKTASPEFVGEKMVDFFNGINNNDSFVSKIVQI